MEQAFKLFSKAEKDDMEKIRKDIQELNISLNFGLPEAVEKAVRNEVASKQKTLDAAEKNISNIRSTFCQFFFEIQISPEAFRIDLESLRKEMKEDCQKIAPEIQSLSAEVSSLMPGIAETYTEVVDLKYRQGIERIEASHQVYSDRISVDLEDWVSKFDRLELEMEAEFRLYTNSQRVRQKIVE